MSTSCGHTFANMRVCVLFQFASPYWFALTLTIKFIIKPTLKWLPDYNHFPIRFICDYHFLDYIFCLTCFFFAMSFAFLFHTNEWEKFTKVFPTVVQVIFISIRWLAGNTIRRKFMLSDANYYLENIKWRNYSFHSVVAFVRSTLRLSLVFCTLIQSVNDSPTLRDDDVDRN